MRVPLRLNPRPLLTRLTRAIRLPGVNLGVASALMMARLSPRERQFVCAAGVALGGVLLYLCVVDPLWEAHTRLRARVAAKERELHEVVALRRTYEALRREVERARPAGGTNVSPFVFLEGLTASTLGRDKLAAINPTGHENRDGVEQEVIELKLIGVSLRELIELLYKIDTAGATLRCTSLSIKKRYKDPYTFDASLTALALSAR
jgi:general secretion pathway protein M